MPKRGWVAFQLIRRRKDYVQVQRSQMKSNEGSQRGKRERENHKMHDRIGLILVENGAIFLGERKIK